MQDTRVDEGRLLLELARDVTATLDLQEVLDRTFAALRRLIDFGGGAIQLVEEDVLVAVATDPQATSEALTVRIPVGQGVSGGIAATGEPCYIPDIWDDPRVHPEGRSKGVSDGVRSYFGAPLILHGRPIGVVQIDSPRADAFPPDVRARVLGFLPTVAAAVQNAQLYEREREAIERIRETERLHRDFLLVVSHEFRTPLTSIVGFGYTLANHARALDEAAVADMGERMWRAGRRIERMMGDLLDLSHIERGTFRVEIHPTDVAATLGECVHEQQGDEHPIELSLEPSLPHVVADPERLHQVIGNLVSNARKFSPHGTPISVRATHQADRVAIEVADRGPGIPPEFHERIFERFFQIDPASTRGKEGLGVGLHLVRELCDRMGATVSVESEPGRGARFTIRLLRAA